MLISFAVTAKLICVFVFAYADCLFSHDAAQILIRLDWNFLCKSGGKDFITVIKALVLLQFC